MTDIKFREIEYEDIEMIRNWRNSKEVSQYMYTENIISKEEQERWFERIKQDISCRYWIIEYEDKDLGLVSITEINKTFDSCFWAFYLGDTSCRGLGIGSKIEYKVLQYVFEELCLNKLRCEVLITNSNVIAMHEKFGFRREAYYREHVKKGSDRIDVVGLAMLRKDWLQVKDFHKKRIFDEKI